MQYVDTQVFRVKLFIKGNLKSDFRGREGVAQEVGGRAPEQFDWVSESAHIVPAIF